MNSKLICVIVSMILTCCIINADTRSNAIEFQTIEVENGETHLRIHLEWEDDPDITAFKVFAVPSNTLLFVCMKNMPPDENTMKLRRLDSKSGAVGISNATVQLNDYLVTGDNGFRLTKVLSDNLKEEELLNMKVDNFTGIYHVKSVFPAESNSE